MFKLTPIVPRRSCMSISLSAIMLSFYSNNASNPLWLTRSTSDTDSSYILLMKTIVLSGEIPTRT